MSTLPSVGSSIQLILSSGRGRHMVAYGRQRNYRSSKSGHDRHMVADGRKANYVARIAATADKLPPICLPRFQPFSNQSRCYGGRQMAGKWPRCREASVKPSQIWSSQISWQADGRQMVGSDRQMALKRDVPVTADHLPTNCQPIAPHGRFGPVGIYI